MNTKNQLLDPINNSYQYDAAGNVIFDGSHHYLYDAENRLIQVDPHSGYCSSQGNTSTAAACYVYDALGRRVAKIPASGVWTQYAYDLSGNVISEYGEGCGPTCWARGYVYFNGQRIAEYANSTTYFAHNDHLGSPRLFTDVTAAYTTDCYDFLPFGERNLPTTPCRSSSPPSPPQANTSHLFTGKERDAESGLDNFGKRYFGSSLGRFMSLDPLLNSGQPWDPQTWNRYSYTLNNPLRYTDPLGLYVWGNCTGDAAKCKAEQQRFRDSIAKAKGALKNLDPKSKEAKALRSALNKLGEEGKGDIKINFGDAGKTNGEPNLGRTVGHNITINYDAVDSEAKDFNLNPSEAAALDAGVTTHEATHALGNGLFGLVQGHFEHPAYYSESVTYQGLHNTDKVLDLWNESWLKVDQNTLEQNRENAIQNAIHPPKQQPDQKPENQ